MSGPLLQDVQALPIGSAPIGYTTPLAAFWVGDMDIFAAETADQALALATAGAGEWADYSLDDVTAVTPAELARTLIDEGGTPDGTLAELLASATAPGWLMGTE